MSRYTLFLSAVSFLVSNSLVRTQLQYEGKWWQNAVFYEIYPQSFYDSNGDGCGDLNGIVEKVDYLNDLNVNAVWLNPIYPSPGKDSGYDISNFVAIHPRFGTMNDFLEMVEELTVFRGIKVIMDFVPNHTSDQHPWFKKSVKRINPYIDYYIWKDPKGWQSGEPIPPNNWESIFNLGTPGSAWEWNDERQQFYFHAFGVQQPDLNLRNSKVIGELQEVLRFWMERGVRGFRLDAVPHLIEDKYFRDEPVGHHIYTQNLPETYRLVEEIRAFIDQYSEENIVDIFFTAEAYASLKDTNRYYGSPQRPGVHFPYNFRLLTHLRQGTEAHSLNHAITEYLDSLTPEQYPNWVSGNHDWPRIPSRMESKFGVEIVNFLNLLLPGTANVYMGDEIGMDSYWDIDWNQCPPEVRYDNRIPSRTPFHWSQEKNAGFTISNRPWLPVNPNHKQINVAYQECRRWDLKKTSYLENFKLLVKLKEMRAFSQGNITTHVLNDQLFVFTRQYESHNYVVLINLDDYHSKTFDIKEAVPGIRRDKFTKVKVRSLSLLSECLDGSDCVEKVFSNDWSMPPESALVLYFYQD